MVIAKEAFPELLVASYPVPALELTRNLKPLLFRGGVGVVAMRKHRSRSEGVAAGCRGYAMEGCLSDERNHPNPSFKKEGLRG